jgi:ATP-dependent DNA ligase
MVHRVSIHFYENDCHSILVPFRAKCGNGFDDATLEKLQNDLKPNMTKISKNPNQIPKWCSISRELAPDFIVIDPKKSPVWEITVKSLIYSFR